MAFSSQVIDQPFCGSISLSGTILVYASERRTGFSEIDIVLEFFYGSGAGSVVSTLILLRVLQQIAMNLLDMVPGEID